MKPLPFILIALMLAGCAPIGTEDNGFLISAKDTPTQVYYKIKRDVERVNFAIGIASLSGQIPAPLAVKIRASQNSVVELMNRARQYIIDHPEIAKTPGAVVPELNAFSVAAEALKAYRSDAGSIFGPSPLPLPPVN